MDPKRDDAFGVPDARRVQENLADEAEDGGVGPDAERERGDGGDGEDRTSGERAAGEAQIEQDGILRAGIRGGAAWGCRLYVSIR